MLLLGTLGMAWARVRRRMMIRRQRSTREPREAEEAYKQPKEAAEA